MVLQSRQDRRLRRGRYLARFDAVYETMRMRTSSDSSYSLDEFVFFLYRDEGWND